MNKEGNLVLSLKAYENIIFVIPPSSEETTISLSGFAIKSNQASVYCAKAGGYS